MDPWGTPNKTFMRRLLDPLTWTTVPAFCWTNNPETIKALPLAHPFFYLLMRILCLTVSKAFRRSQKIAIECSFLSSSVPRTWCIPVRWTWCSPVSRTWCSPVQGHDVVLFHGHDVVLSQEHSVVHTVPRTWCSPVPKKWCTPFSSVLLSWVLLSFPQGEVYITEEVYVGMK